MPSAAVLGSNDSLELNTLLSRYRSGELSPGSVLLTVLDRIEKYGDPAVWISRSSAADVFSQLEAAERKRDDGIAQPLLGIPFAVKDNIDVAGHPTTAACPAFSYKPAYSATVVRRLCDAGAIVMGKTNLDQFATGLVGTRTPYGICKNVFDDRYLSGGSSSGSAVAVAGGLVSFSLGTDTAGSGRVPAAFNNLVGLKPSCGRLSTSGVVPACRSLDCVSIFTHRCEAAKTLLRIAEGYDPTDAYSRAFGASSGFGAVFRFGVLAESDRDFFGDDEAAELYKQAIAVAEKLGGRAVTFNFAPFLEAASLLYSGPWVAERAMVARDLLSTKPEALHPITRGILQAGLNLSGLEVFEGLHRLEALRAQVTPQWKPFDFLLLPTTGTIYTVDQVLADPLKTNTNLGRYTNFVNLLNLCGVAIPAGFRSNGLPVGVSVIAPAGKDIALLDIGDRFHRAVLAKDFSMPAAENPISTHGRLKLAVVGAHLSGMPLNQQLTDRGATLVRACKTAPLYRLYALPGTKPPKPGLVRVESSRGMAIELEIWEMDPTAFAEFVAAIPGPLGIGSIIMDDEKPVQGFLCETYAVSNAPDISHFGGWRNYTASLSQA